MSRVMELAIAIKGRLDGSVASSMQRAIAESKELKTQIKAANDAMRNAQRAASAEQRATGQVSVASYRQIAALQARINDLTQRRSDILDAQARKQKAQAAFDNAQSKLSSTATKVAISAAPLIAATKAAVDFESAMADVRKVVDFDTPQQFAQMNEDVLKLSTNLPMAADDIAKIVAAGGQAGIARQDLMQFAEDAVKMGVAFDVTAEQAGDMMAKWRSAFKLNQQDVVALADKINYLGNTTAASAPLISDVVTRIGPLGEIGGVASGEIAALGASMIATGVQSDVAATGIKNLILGMTAGEGATKSQAAAFQQLGFDAADMAKRMQTDAKGAIMDVFRALQSLPKDQQASVLADLFGKESIGAIAPLLTNLDALESNFKKVGDASQYAGSMEAEYQARSRTTANQLQLAKNAIVAVGIGIGSALLPAINGVLNAIIPVVSAFANWAQQNQGIVQTMVALAASFAGVLLAARSLLAIRAGFNMLKETARLFYTVNQNGQIVLRGAAMASNIFKAGLSGLGTAFRLAATGARALAMALMANPIIAIIAVIIAVVAAIIYFWNTNEQFRAAVIAIWNNIVAFGTSLFSALAAFFAGVWNGMVAIATAVWSGIMTVATMAVSVIMDIISAFGAFFTGVWNGCLAIASAVWDAISSFVSAAASVIEGIISALVDYISSAWDSAVAAVQSFASSVMDAIGQAVDWAMDKWNSLVNALSHPIDTAINIAQNITRTISEATSSGDDVSENARGGIYQRGAFLTTFAEDSAEAAIPLDGSARAISLWQQAGAALGVMPKTPQRMSAGTAKAPMYSNSSITLDFRPTINVQGGGDVASAVRQALEEQARQFQRELPKMLDKVSAGRRRLSYE
ncbi:phage tail tape measure protein [uncultured Megasphaera sp.]|uniref:phage tail tape measure protein n=1 Tax=uncultured Megasphaera sp. TaxID=165188 RepID=UPI002592D85B|nr:phage tail tape measure protein [uncultured Megasphaera sp.]